MPHLQVSTLCSIEMGLPKPHSCFFGWLAAYKINTCIGGWPNGTTKSSQLTKNRSIVWLQSHSHLTITKQLGKSWLELAEVAKRWKMWLVLAEDLSLIKFKPTQSNSSQLKPSGWPNDTQFHQSCELGLSWEDRLARNFKEFLLLHEFNDVTRWTIPLILD